MDKQDNLPYIAKCLKEIERKLDWGNPNQWHSNVFQELSESIQKETGVLLSATTLKRVWGRVAHNGTPSISTLDTLSQFAGYLNWRDFKTRQKNPERSISLKHGYFNTKTVLLSVFIVGILSISLFWAIASKQPEKELSDYSQVRFSSRPVTEGLPNSVVFDFDLGRIQTTNLKIQQYWDATKTITVQPEHNQATGIYYYPGHFRAKLLIDDEIVKEHHLSIKSNGWLGTVDYDPIPKYVDTKELLKNNGLSFPEYITEEVKSLEEIRRTSFHLVQDFGELSGDNFSLSTGIRNTHKDKWAVCQATNIVVLGTKGAMIIPFSIPGCVSNLNLMLNDVYLDGKEHDLSAFGVDFTGMRNINLSVKKKTVTISVDGAEIYKGNYNEPIGNFVGLRYRFLGIGEINYLKIMDSTGISVLDTDFHPLVH